MYNICIFTYKEDFDCLKVNLETLNKVAPSSKVFLFNDYYNPLSELEIKELKQINKSTSCRTTYFDRKGRHYKRSLNGLECLRGMVTCYKSINNKKPFIKLDSDTLLTSTKIFDEKLGTEYDVIGFESYVPFAFTGVSYAFTHKALGKFIDILVKRGFSEFSKDHQPEDVYFSRMAAISLGERFGLIKSDNGLQYPEECYSGAIHEVTEDKLLQYYNFFEMCKNLTSLHCGQENLGITRPQCADLMKFFAKLI